MTDFTTLIGAGELAALDSGSVRVFDCRFDLADPDAGKTHFNDSHIPGAVYLHLDRDLAGPVVPGRTGRHPLPNRDAFRGTLRTHGVADDSQVVAYDDAGGMFAARCWWMVRWAGHARVAVLDGGFQAWQAMADGTRGAGTRTSLPSAPEPRPTTVAMPELRSHDGGPKVDAPRRTRPRPLRRHQRDHRSAGRPHPKRPERSFRGQSHRPTDASPTARRCGAASNRCSGVAKTSRPSAIAARASRRPTTSWRWSTPGSRNPPSTPDRGASGSPTPDNPVET